VLGTTDGDIVGVILGDVGNELGTTVGFDVDGTEVGVQINGPTDTTTRYRPVGLLTEGLL
jgi:hypothetical protein